ncbi:putative chromosome segregation protein Cse1 [Rhizodiscina lignyota]|uniref:Chromosome segregation protein Cse1 n=1 Tax=Rhizodiscina lignyota TaxID=1504668 RepID=A0A9P4M4Z1_9PEZI|nr:putative chromosome segregation protein Cse1 [Rhizodiscina lignyota]
MAAADLQAIAQLLQASLDPAQNKQAEKALQESEKQPQFSVALLHIVASDSFPPNTRLASALFFKNFIRRNWTDENGVHKLPEDEVTAIKKELIGLMISVPPSIQSQLGEAISEIADSDFWDRWDSLVDDLVSRLTPDNAVVNNGVLQVAHSIFKRWRPLFRSDELFTEINHVLSKFSTPFLTLLERTDAMIGQSQNNKEALSQYFQTMNLMMKLFYDLSCQDLPPAFEDNLAAITTLLHKYLVYDNPLLHTDDEAESGILEYVKAGIFEVLVLYVQKYEDAFGAHLGQFVNSSWEFLTKVGPETKYDILVSKALQFLTSVTHIRQHAEAFNNDQTLGQVVEKVILPNLSLRESDVELFEDEPIEFIRRDLEGSDSDTRRRAATDFLRQLMEQFEQLVSSVVTKYIDHYLQDYASNPAQNWKSKDTAVYLFSSIAAKGSTTTAHGVRDVNTHVNILDFFQQNIASDLTNDSLNPILIVDAIKFTYVFRSQLTPQLWSAAFPLLVKHLGSSNYVIYTYASIAVERVLTMHGDDRTPVIPTETVTGLSKDLLQHLFSLMTRDKAPEKIQENEYLMKCVMRVLLVIKDGVLPITDMVLKSFISITMVIRHNPSNPKFYYFHFEAIGALIRYAGPSRAELLEKSLYEPFSNILEADVAEFTPYVFQLFAALLEANPSGSLPEFYERLIQPILHPVLWESKGNRPALVRLLSSIMPRGAEVVVKNGQIEPILGVFQKLASSKISENQGFDLLEALIQAVPVSALQPYFVSILQIMLTRLSDPKMKTENFSLRFARFFHFVSARDEQGLGCDFFIKTTDQIQNDVFRPIYTSIILPDTQKLTRPSDRKIAVVSFTKILADSEAFIERYKKGWALTCQALLKLLINPPQLTTAQHDDILVNDDTDDVGFGVTFTQLQSIKPVVKDPFPQIPDVKVWVGQYLREADSRHSGKITNYVQERLSDEAKSALQLVLQG